MTETVVVTILKAVNLEPKCPNGFSEPYAEVTCYNSKLKTLNTKFKTRVISKTLNPAWNETFYCKLNAKDPIKIEIFSNKLIGRDFEGMCTIEWWTDQELGTTGVTTLEVPLKPSALGLNRKVKGKVVVKLQLAYFAEHVNNSLELQKFCPDVPCDEKIVDKIKCAFAADVPREGLEDLPSVVLTPGIAFLLDNYVYCYGVGGTGGVQNDFMYNVIKEVIPSQKRKGTVVVKLIGGRNIVLGDMNETGTLVGFLTSMAGKGEDGLGADGRPVGFGTNDDDIKSCQITFKIWCEETGQGRMMSTYTNVTFEEIKNKALAAAGLAGATDEYRLFASPPAFRSKYCNDLAYDPKDKVAKALRSKTINFGDMLVLKKYNAGEKPYLKDKGNGVYGLSSGRGIYVNVEWWKNWEERSSGERVKVELGVELDEVVRSVCAAHGGDGRQGRLYRVGRSVEPGDGVALVELDKKETMDQVYMSEGDMLVVRCAPPFKTFSEKFGAVEETGRTAYSLAAHCYFNPVHRVWKGDSGESPLPGIAAKLGLSSEVTRAVEEAAREHAAYGSEAILVELADRIVNTGSNGYYGAKTFESRDAYRAWLEEQRSEVLELMEMSVTERAGFSSEVEVRVVRGTNLLAADLNGRSDPYTTIVYKTQRKSTEVKYMTLNPEWNETLLLRVAYFDAPIGIFVYDKDIDADDLLGTARFSLRDHSEVLDGRPHEYTVELENKEMRGTLTLEVTCHHAYSQYFAFVRDYDFSKPDAAALPSGIPYIAYYNTLLEASGELESLNVERPWYLREFSSRFGVSEGYCAFMKLQTLMAQGKPFSGPAFYAISSNVQRLVRASATANREETTSFVRALETFLTKIKESYLTDLLLSAIAQQPPQTQTTTTTTTSSSSSSSSSSTTTTTTTASSSSSSTGGNKTNIEARLVAKNFEATAALVRETVDYLARTAPGRSAETAGDILTQGFAQAAGVLFREMATSTGKLDWANPVSVLGYRKVIATVYTERIRAALEAAEAASGEDEKVRRALYEKAVSALSANAQREIGRYCGVANSVLGGTNMELSSRVKENAYETLMALARLRESITERTGVVMPGSIFLMLLLIWLRTANEQLAGWVKAAIKQDMTARLQQENADAIRSVSFVDVSDAIDQTLAQVEEMGVDNHMIWTQVGELLLQAVQGYVETEGSYATKMATSYVRSPSSVNLFRNVCVSLANMERAQTLISELISAIEDNLDKLAATASNGDEDSDAVAMRVNAAHDSLDIAVHDTLCACKKAFATTVGVLAKARAETVVAAFTANPADVRGATKTFIDVYDAALNDLNASTQRTVFNKILPVFADTFMDVFLAALRPEVLLVRGKKSGGNIFSVPLNLFKSTIVSAVGAIKDNNAFDDKIAAEMSKNAAFVPMYTAFFNEAIDYFENGISRDALTKNPTFTAVQQFAKIYNVSTETLISLHMRLTANQPLAQEEKALYGHVDADAIYTLIKYRDISGDRWADAYTDEKNGSDKSQKTREVLGLSQSEFFIADYKAFNAKYILTTKHLAYDPLVSRKETTVIDLLKITRMTVEGSVKKSLIVTVTGEVTPYKLNAPMSSDDFINEVTTQAIAAGNTFLQPKKKIKLPFQM